MSLYEFLELQQKGLRIITLSLRLNQLRSMICGKNSFSTTFLTNMAAVEAHSRCRCPGCFLSFLISTSLPSFDTFLLNSKGTEVLVSRASKSVSFRPCLGRASALARLADPLCITGQLNATLVHTMTSFPSVTAYFTQITNQSQEKAHVLGHSLCLALKETTR